MSPPNEGQWWFDGRDLLVKRDGVWRPKLSPDDKKWHALTAEDCKEIAAAMNARPPLPT